MTIDMQIEDVNVRSTELLITPAALKMNLPLSPTRRVTPC
jgi:3-deoxy-7-phosphoheptulonate synthase